MKKLSPTYERYEWFEEKHFKNKMFVEKEQKNGYNFTNKVYLLLNSTKFLQSIFYYLY